MKTVCIQSPALSGSSWELGRLSLSSLGMDMYMYFLLLCFLLCASDSCRSSPCFGMRAVSVLFFLLNLYLIWSIAVPKHMNLQCPLAPKTCFLYLSNSMNIQSQALFAPFTSAKEAYQVISTRARFGR